MQAGIHGDEVDVRHVSQIDALVARCDNLRLERLEARLQREPVCQSVVHVSFKRRRSFWRDKERAETNSKYTEGMPTTRKSLCLSSRIVCHLTQLMSLGLRLASRARPSWSTRSRKTAPLENLILA